MHPPAGSISPRTCPTQCAPTRKAENWRKVRRREVHLRSIVLVSVQLLEAWLLAAAQGSLEDYQRAAKFLPGNLRHTVYAADAAAHWFNKTDRFCRNQALCGRVDECEQEF